MLDSSTNSHRPTVSIILPTFNREDFLPDAMAAIRGQELTDWELIVVDDGSTDNSEQLIETLAKNMPQAVRYVFQQNQGAFAARNTGLDLARGQYIACYDSDDLWLPHHLQRCVQALDANPDVDWVYGACRTVGTDGQVFKQHNFHPDGKPREFLSLRTRQSGDLRIIDDHRLVEFAIKHGLYCGPQNSVCRKRVFNLHRYPPFQPVEDQLLVLLAVKSQVKFAYFDDVHVIYRIHDGNASWAAANSDVDKNVRIIQSLIDGQDWIRERTQFSRREARLLNHKTASQYFWRQGYVLYRAGRVQEALAKYRLGLSRWPTNLRFWKTYLGTRLQVALGLEQAG